MTRREILSEVKDRCIKEYENVSNWVHGILHVQRVVDCGRRIAVTEGYKSKDVFLVELACWLHDVGRSREESGLSYAKSGHAEISYFMSKKMIRRYDRKLGRESVYKVLQAVREHSLPVLNHKENNIARVLVDAERCSAINMIGVMRVLSYYGLFQSGPVKTLEEARKFEKKAIDRIVETGKVQEAVDNLSVILDWYYGNKKQKITGEKVNPLYMNSSREMFAGGVKEVEEFIEKVRERGE